MLSRLSRLYAQNRSLQLLTGALALVALAVGVAIVNADTGSTQRPLAAHSPMPHTNSQFAGTGLPPTIAAARHTSYATAAAQRVLAHGAATKPNIVFVLTDDLSLDLLRYMPAVEQMQRQGVSFSNYFVADSLCCPSRSSIFTGEFPHDTGVFANTGKHGGFGAFYARGDENYTFNDALMRAGYNTAIMGKYLNGYLESAGGAPVPDTYVPPGWTEWDGVGNGYPEYSYVMNTNGQVVQYGAAPQDYLTYVVAVKGIGFINQSVAAGKPFFLELSTFSPHRPYVPAPQDLNAFPGLTAPRPPNFDVLPSDPPRWLAGHAPLSAADVNTIDEAFRLRAQAVQSVDRLITAIRNQLAADGVAGNTYIVFSSDNGLHTGEYRLTPGKLTAFDTDIHVPLIVDGPGVPAGKTTSNVAENIDLASTFTQIGGATLHADGQSLLPLIKGKNPADWRNAALVEHHGSDLGGIDPDFQQTSGGNPRTYEAMRTPNFLFVEYNDGEREFYNLKTDPFELHNIASQLTPYEASLLHLELTKMQACHGATKCWAALHVDASVGPLSSAPVR